MVEEEKDEVPPSTSNESLDWDKLFKLAEDPDIEDIIRGPLETAIKNLQEGKEILKLQAIRSLPDLLESDGEETIDKLLPAIQRTLRDEKSNLDIHCEAAVVFKGVLQSDKLCAMFPNLLHTLLQNILDNISGQKDNSSDGSVRFQMGPSPAIHNLSTAAWLETLVEIADRVSLESLKQYIVPVVQQQAEPSQRVQRRIIATKLLHKLADILPSSEVRKELGPCAQMLCSDANSNVRTAMAHRLPVIARALKNPSDTVSLLLPCFVQLCKDDDVNVRESCMNMLAQCLPHFTKEAKVNTIFPLIKKCADQSMDKRDDILMVIAKNMGEWSFQLHDMLDPLDKSWILNTYLKIVSISQASADNAPLQSVLTTCRRMCAFNLPCIVELYPKAFERIFPVFEAFCSDSDDEVRLAMAASFHEILNRQPNKSSILQPFIELIRGGASEVVSKITRHLDQMIPILYRLANNSDSKVSQLQLDRILVGCNQLLRGTGSWRGHEALLRHLAVLKDVLSYQQLFDTFVPVLQKEVLHVRAIPCRIAAVNTLLLFMREQPEQTKRQEIIDFFKLEIAKHPCCYRRSLFLDVVQLSLQLFSRRFFLQNFFVDTLQMTHDDISNIRLKAIRLLPRVRTFLILPDDDDTLQKFEQAVRDSLSTEKQTETRKLIQAAACELSRSETMRGLSREDAMKEDEEDKLWDEKRILEKKTSKLKNSPSSSESSDKSSPKPSGLRIPEQVRATSPWKQTRRAVAVVRPQPVVVFRSASPAPKISDGGRPSRLPLSTASRDKEALKKTTIDSVLPRSSTSRASSLSRNGMSTSASSAMESSYSSSACSSPTTSTPPLGLRRSATTTTGFGSKSTSQMTSYPLSSSRSSSSLRRPTFSLSRVSSQSTLERKPPQFSVRIKNT